MTPIEKALDIVPMNGQTVHEQVAAMRKEHHTGIITAFLDAVLADPEVQSSLEDTADMTWPDIRCVVEALKLEASR